MWVDRRARLEEDEEFVTVGDVPPADVDKRVRQILANGEAAILPEELLRALNHRRLLAKQIRPYLEAHHIAGTVIDLEEPGKQEQ